jgi:hypothetical protein
MRTRRGGADFDVELGSHIAMHIDDGVRSGLSEEESRRRGIAQRMNSLRFRRLASPRLRTLI